MWWITGQKNRVTSVALQQVLGWRQLSDSLDGSAQAAAEP
jgi:hypothetical protein